jgi:hypothetical protein
MYRGLDEATGMTGISLRILCAQIISSLFVDARTISRGDGLRDLHPDDRNRYDSR